MPAGASTSSIWPALPVKRENFSARVRAPPLALSARTAPGSRAAPSTAPITQAPWFGAASEGATKEICMLYLRARTG
jgi:hypothetical protein